MKNLEVFKTFFGQSRQIYRSNINLFLMSYMAFLGLCLTSILPLENLGFTDGWVVIIALFIGFSGLIIVANIVLTEKARLLGTKKEKLIYGAPTYLVYALYSSLAVLLGILLFIIPGFIALIFLSLAPVASLLSVDKSKGYLKQSIELVKKNTGLVSLYVVASLLVEIVSLLIDLIPDWRVRSGVGFLYAFVEAYAMLILALVSVKIFYHLRGPST
jgi:hypothetical protein